MKAGSCAEPIKHAAAASTVHASVDEQAFSFFHLKAICVAGTGFFTDAYDLFAISVVKPLIAIIYYPHLNGKLPLTADLWLTGIALAGTLCGQVFFGILGDRLGRKKVYLLTLMLMIGATIGQSLSASPLQGVGVMTIICFWRFVLGFGIGGDYPLSATIMSEYSSTRWRGSFLAAVFAMQGLGIVASSIVSIITVRCFKHAITQISVLYLDYVWRIVLGFGCIPAVLTIYLRNKLPETPRFTADVVRDTEKAARDVDYVTNNLGQHFDDDDHIKTKSDVDRIDAKKLHRYLTYPSIIRNRNFWVLIGTCSTWFLLDIAFYSQNLFLPNVLTYIGYNPSITMPNAAWYKADPQHYPANMFVGIANNVTLHKVFLADTPHCGGACAEAVYQKAYKTASGNAIVAMMGTVPGYWFSIAFMDYMGRVPIQFGGFGLMTALLIVLASAYTQIVHASKWLFIVLYALTFFFANFGPNTTTFVTPVELFATKYRSTLHGISAASGKAGAIVGAFAIGKLFLDTKVSLQTTLAILAATNLVGMLCTAFIPETMRLPLMVSCSETQSLFGRILARRFGIQQVDPDHVDFINEDMRESSTELTAGGKNAAM
ncbi:hypothetical protein WJX72_002836 [[Myrmecia] bisecta]|uniref:Major facilitator superfamily (MFS) profile domain-containing protein n=1 Tax=[Myrmecia] bisecta TaxID=41462 RepID=A0AAW1P5V7_9CHLO